LKVETFSTVAFVIVKGKRWTAIFVGALLGAVTVQGGAQSAPVGAPWHLDRINQQVLPLDGDVAHGPLNGQGIDIYIVDTGVRATHEQFVNRTLAGLDVRTADGSSVVDPPGSDCDGHGTHVAGLAAGSTVGVATGARIISVRVLDCNGSGEVPDVVPGLQWIRAHHRSGVAAVANLSFGVDLGDDGTTIDKEVRALINEGVVVTIAAGNGDDSGTPIDACKIAPGDVAGALTVGAVSVTDAVAYYSNDGPCVDLYAPGGDSTRAIESSWSSTDVNSDAEYGNDVGTSMASPLVAGYAALLAQQQPGLCVPSIVNAIVARATPGVITGLTATSPNKLLFLEQSPVASSVPGVASHISFTTDYKSLVVKWDPPCDGGSPITSTKVSLLLSGKVVRSLTANGTKRSVRFEGLRTGVKYQARITATNAVGVGKPKNEVAPMAVRSVVRGQFLKLEQVGSITGPWITKWTVVAETRSICRVNNSTRRFAALKRGTCKVYLRAITGQKPVIHFIRIS
jgi:subtilisin family serine protease